MKFWKISMIFVGFFGLVESVKVAIDLKNARPIREVPKEFLSMSIDTSLIQKHFSAIDWRKAIILTQALTPAYLRIGGTMADALVFGGETLRINQSTLHASSFEYEASVEIGEDPLASNFTMTAGDLDRLGWFLKSSNLTGIFDLNVLFRTENDQWDWQSNVQSLLTYAQTQRYNFHFELGNEPDLFKNHNVSLSAAQLAQDYHVLKSVLKKFPFFSKSNIFGPAVANLVKEKSHIYFEDFLKHGGEKSVDALTFHQYYFDGQTAREEQFVDPVVMNGLLEEIGLAKELVKKHVPEKPNFPLWLGETASAYGGGAEGLSDSFVAGFLWLDKLGLSALHGLDVVVRQSLYGGHYSLFDERTDPRPDYWLSVLFKQLVGSTVLKLKSITNPESLANYTRFYAHCSNERTTIFGMNLHNDAITVTITNGNESPAFDFYLLTPEKGNILSKTITLNSQPITFDGFRLPVLKGVRKEKPVAMPPKSMAFFTFNQRLVDCTLQ